MFIRFQEIDEDLTQAYRPSVEKFEGGFVGSVCLTDDIERFAILIESKLPILDSGETKPFTKIVYVTKDDSQESEDEIIAVFNKAFSETAGNVVVIPPCVDNGVFYIRKSKNQN